MSPQSSEDVLISIDTIDQLFNDPAINPFSNKPALILGKAALPYTVRQAMGKGLRDWSEKRLIIQLPADQITPNLQTQVVTAVRKFAETKRTDNEALIRITRWSAMAGLIVAVTIAVVLLLLLVIAVNTVLAASSGTAAGLLTGLVTIFIWATVWHPWEKLVYEWIEPWLENRILQNITKMDIIIQPETVVVD
jgi:hypothetical protein